MNSQRGSRRDAEIAALHAVVISLGQSAGTKMTGGKWWVFTSHTASGETIFTYKHTEGINPGGAWVEVPNARLDSFLHRALMDGTHEVRAGSVADDPCCSGGGCKICDGGRGI